MKIESSTWHDFSVAIERGPLVYALKIRGEERPKDRADKYRAFTEVYPLDPWNYGLIENDLADPGFSRLQIVQNNWDGSYPWNLENTPIQINMRGIRIDQWQLTNGAPYFPAFWGTMPGNASMVEAITLIPYGCTTLRITEFPVYGLNE